MRKEKNELLFDRNEQSSLYNWNGFQVKDTNDECMNTTKVWMTSFFPWLIDEKVTKCFNIYLSLNQK